jgi:microcompartment protein CcmK/EutM
MLMGKVVGTVVATHKDEGMTGFKLLVVQNVDLTMKLTSSYVVATDSVGAGLGEVVIVVQGSSARLTDTTKNKPVDAAVICIVDTIDVDGKLIYEKGHERRAPQLEMLQTANATG